MKEILCVQVTGYRHYDALHRYKGLIGTRSKQRLKRYFSKLVKDDLCRLKDKTCSCIMRTMDLNTVTSSIDWGDTAKYQKITNHQLIKRSFYFTET